MLSASAGEGRCVFLHHVMPDDNTISYPSHSQLTTGSFSLDFFPYENPQVQNKVTKENTSFLLEQNVRIRECSFRNVDLCFASDSE